MKILIASDTYYPNVNGAAYFTVRLAENLAKKGHQVSVICPSETTQNTVTPRNGVLVYGVPSLPVLVYKDFRISPRVMARKSIEKIVAKIHPDVIHIQNHFMIGKAITQIAVKMKIPIMGTNHFMPENLVHYFHLPLKLEEKLKNFGYQQFLKVYDQMKIVTSPTRTAGKIITDLGFEKEIIPISCGIDLKRFNPENNGDYLKTRYHIPNKKIILFVGRLDKEKNIDIIIQALPEVLSSVDVQFVVAGNGAFKKNLEKKAEKLNISSHLTFTGFVPDSDLPNLYKIADLFVIAGTAELQSIVTMEAMASGLPVIGANAVALPELIHHEENGFLFEPGNSQELARDIIKILSNPELHHKMSAKSLEIIQNHNIEKSTANFEELYSQLINNEKNTSNT